MSLLRKNIKQVIKTALIDAATVAADRVYVSRPDALPHDAMNLPAILIYTPSERDDLYAEAPKLLKRMADISIELIAEGPSLITAVPSFDEIMEDFAEQVEQAIFALTETQLGCGLRFNGDSSDFDDRGRKPLSGIILRFTAEFEQEIPESPENIAELDKVHVDYDIPDGEPIDASDDVVI